MESNFFREKREELRMTQREISIALDVTETTVRNWEGFKTHPPLSMAAQISKVYRVSQSRIEQAIVECARAIQKREAATAK